MCKYIFLFKSDKFFDVYYFIIARFVQYHNAVNFKPEIIVCRLKKIHSNIIVFIFHLWARMKFHLLKFYCFLSTNSANYQAMTTVIFIVSYTNFPLIILLFKILSKLNYDIIIRQVIVKHLCKIQIVFSFFLNLQY